MDPKIAAVEVTALETLINQNSSVIRENLNRNVNLENQNAVARAAAEAYRKLAGI